MHGQGDDLIELLGSSKSKLIHQLLDDNPHDAVSSLDGPDDPVSFRWAVVNFNAKGFKSSLAFSSEGWIGIEDHSKRKSIWSQP